MQCHNICKLSCNFRSGIDRTKETDAKTMKEVILVRQLSPIALETQFTPPLKACRDDVPQTPESDDDDLKTLSSRASSARKRVQPKFVFVESNISKDRSVLIQGQIEIYRF